MRYLGQEMESNELMEDLLVDFIYDECLPGRVSDPSRSRTWRF